MKFISTIPDSGGVGYNELEKPVKALCFVEGPDSTPIEVMVVSMGHDTALVKPTENGLVDLNDEDYDLDPNGEWVDISNVQFL